MICYKDRTFCVSDVKEHTCECELTEEIKEAAKKWWGDDNPPIAVAEYCSDKTVQIIEGAIEEVSDEHTIDQRP